MRYVNKLLGPKGIQENEREAREYHEELKHASLSGHHSSCKCHLCMSKKGYY